MPQDNVRFIQDVYAAYARGDSQYILNNTTDDVEWINEGPEAIPYAGTFKGRQQVQRFFQNLGTTVDNGKVTATEWVAEGENVVAIGRFTATVKATGKRI